MDFIHTSAKIEGNTYDKHDTYTLLEYGCTAGGKKYSDAKMILNMRDTYDKFIAEDLIETYKETIESIVAVEESRERERNTPLRV